MKRVNIRRISIILIIVLLSMSLISCKRELEEDIVEGEILEEDREEEILDEEEEEENDDDEDQAIVVVDHLGREVVFDKPAEKIVSGYYIPTSMLLALGLKDNIVGIEGKADKRPIYKLAAPEILELPSVGTMKEFDLEGAVALEPDLIVMSVRLKDAVETMADLGINVIAVDPEDNELLNQAINMIAKATDKEENAERLIAYTEEKNQMIKDLVEGEEEKDVYLGGNSSFLSTASSKMYQHSLIEDAGGNNVAGDIDDTYWADISYEQLIAYNPDVIMAVPGTSYSKEDIMNDSKLEGLKAIENNQVYFMPSGFENWDSPIPSGILGKLWLTSILHEDLYSFDEFKDDAYDFYKEFFDLEINKDNISK